MLNLMVSNFWLSVNLTVHDCHLLHWECFNWIDSWLFICANTLIAFLHANVNEQPLCPFVLCHFYVLLFHRFDLIVQSCSEIPEGPIIILQCV